MTREDIVDEFNRLLDDHVIWRRGHWDHRSYKLAFFRLFRAAHEGGLFRLRGRYALTGERVREEIIETWITMVSPKNTYKLGLLQQMAVEWDASALSGEFLARKATTIAPNTASKMRAGEGPSLCFSPCLGAISSLSLSQGIHRTGRPRYARDMDPVRKMTSTGRWKDPQEMKAMPPAGKSH